MRNAVFAINVTLDGCCSHTDLSADDELHEYFTGLLRNADIALFGRKTYQLMFPYWHTIAEHQSETKATNEFARTIDAINKIVFSKTFKSVEMKNTTLSRANIEEELLKLKGQPGKDIFIDGLSIALHLAQLAMIDEYHILVQPLVAGKGPHLFETGGFRKPLQLKFVGSRQFGSGVIALHYKKQSP